MVAQSIRMALKAIMANKTRSFLTMLGIIIGVFSLVVLVSLVDGATSFVTSSISDLGSDYIEISINDNKGNPITDYELTELKNFKGVGEFSVDMSSPNITLNANGKEKKGMVYGINSSYFRIEKFNILYGRNISAVDDENHVRVAVLSYETAQRLYGRADVVGEKITIAGISFDIIGVLEKQEGTFVGFLFGDTSMVYIPFSTYSRIPEMRFTDYTDFLVSVAPDSSVDVVKDTYNNYFYKRFDNDKDAYSVSTQEELSSTLSNVTTVLAVVFGGVAAISLLVGGIGIMNIMLVSVTERTKEIGIRKAIGASTKSILLQFLIEAFVISLTGCLIGLIFSYITIALVNAVVKMFDFQLTFKIPFSIVIGSAVFSLLVGLVFGIYPAQKAANKKPIEALRYDG